MLIKVSEKFILNSDHIVAVRHADDGSTYVVTTAVTLTRVLVDPYAEPIAGSEAITYHLTPDEAMSFRQELDWVMTYEAAIRFSASRSQ